MIPTYNYSARDRNGKIHLFIGKPARHTNTWEETDEYAEYEIPEPLLMPDNFLPELKWEDEPTEIEIVAKIR